MIEAWVNSAAVMELSPELREQMKVLQGSVQEWRVGMSVAIGHDRLRTIVDRNDVERLPQAVVSLEDVYAGEVLELLLEVAGDDTVLTPNLWTETANVEQELVEGESESCRSSEAAQDGDGSEDEEERIIIEEV
jgi:hypothetical protein